MLRNEKDRLLARIISGIYIYRYNQQRYYIYPPTRLIKQLSYDYYDEILNGIMFESWLTEEEALHFLISNDIISKNIDDIISQVQKDTDRTKLEAYNSRLDPPKVKFLKNNISSLNKKMHSLLAAKHSLDHLTKHGYAELCRINFLTLNSIKNEKGEPLNIEDDAILCEYIFSHISSNFIHQTILREISRTEPWRSMWGGIENNPFGHSAVDWTEEQKSLVIFSKMYDNCYKHPECPDDNILEDDDLLDGWMIYQRNKNAEEKKKDGANLGEGEHFIIAKNEEHRREIDKLNDQQAKNIRKQRDEALARNAGKKIKEAFLPDVQQDLRLQANEMFKNKVKGK